jgi:hypothetical protein
MLFLDKTLGNKMKVISSVAVLALLLLNIALIIAAFASRQWSGIGSRSMGLFKCSDCAQLQNSWTFECLARSTCGNSQTTGSCSAYTGLYKAGYAFLVLEFAALLMALLFLEKLLLSLLKQSSGPKVLSYCSAAGMLIFHLIATVLWFHYSQAGQHCPVTTDPLIRPSTCMSIGSEIAIANCVIMAVTLAIFILTTIRSAQPEIPNISLQDLLFIPASALPWIALVLVFLGTGLMLAALTVENWASVAGSKGGLLRCYDCDQTHWMGWECLQGTQCEVNPNSVLCQQYHKQSTAANVFIGLQAVAIVFIVLFLQPLTALVRCRQYASPGFNYVKHI